MVCCCRYNIQVTFYQYKKNHSTIILFSDSFKPYGYIRQDFSYSIPFTEEFFKWDEMIIDSEEETTHDDFDWEKSGNMNLGRMYITCRTVVDSSYNIIEPLIFEVCGNVVQYWQKVEDGVSYKGRTRFITVDSVEEYREYFINALGNFVKYLRK